jgi:diguanylate cyclase (GGDEF)-like protein
MKTTTSGNEGARLLRHVLACLLLWAAAGVHAQPVDLHGRWFALVAAGTDSDGRTEPARRRPVESVSPTGGTFEYEADLSIAQAGSYVLDFKNSSVINRFHHRVTNASGAVVAESAGGISGDGANPFFLRHGRELNLPPGRYRLVSRLDSPFYLAQPEPYLDTLSHYRDAIKGGNALVLLCLGVFLGLGIYYAVLALVRRRTVHAAYALFILGNLLYNGTALLVLRELFDLRAFYLISLPILFSNIAYIVFVVGLLDIRPDTAPRLYRVSRWVIGVMSAFVLVAALRLNWSLELCRFGVAMFLVYGLSAGVLRVLAGNRLARWYVLANIGFFVSGISAISLLNLNGVYSVYIEHLGLGAVAIEVLLLALVLSYQFGMLQNEKVSALANAEENLRLACTDALTGLPNRYALEIDLVSLPNDGSLSFVDLDGLKYYNDRFGHDRGDRLLCDFAKDFSKRLAGIGTLHRLGGDEFAVTSVAGETDAVERLLQATVESMHQSGYELSGASCGSVRVHECQSRDQLKRLADTRMYDDKRRRRHVRDQPSGLEPGAA